MEWVGPKSKGRAENLGDRKEMQHFVRLILKKSVFAIHISKYFVLSPATLLGRYKLKITGPQVC